MTQKKCVGDGTRLPITHIGTTSVLTPYSSRILSLQNLLYVPSITKNLLNVSTFAKDNNVYFEFYPTKYFVKDQVSYLTLMEGNLKKELYAFDSKIINTCSLNPVPPISTDCKTSIVLSTNYKTSIVLSNDYNSCLEYQHLSSNSTTTTTIFFFYGIRDQTIQLTILPKVYSILVIYHLLLIKLSTLFVV